MTKQELIDKRVAQLLELNYTEDAARAEAEALYEDVTLGVSLEMPIAEAPKKRVKKEAEE